MTSPTPRRTRSPWKWPSRSLMALSSSRSIISRQNPRPDRALRAISRSIAAKKNVAVEQAGQRIDGRQPDRRVARPPLLAGDDHRRRRRAGSAR